MRGGILLPRVREMRGDDGNNNRPSREVSSRNVEVCGIGNGGDFFLTFTAMCCAEVVPDSKRNW